MAINQPTMSAQWINQPFYVLNDEAFNTIKNTTGISDIDEIVKIFVKLEERNYSLMVYVNLLSRDIEQLEKTQSDAAAVLSGLLKELLSEQKAADHFSAVFQNWCRDSESQKQSMVVTMQRKVDESNIMMHQISSEVNG